MLFCKKSPFYRVFSFTIAKNIYSFRPFFHFLDNKKSYLYSYRLFFQILVNAAGSRTISENKRKLPFANPGILCPQAAGEPGSFTENL